VLTSNIKLEKKNVLFCKKEPKNFCESGGSPATARCGRGHLPVEGMAPKQKKVFCFFFTKKKTFLPVTTKRKKSGPRC